MRKIAGVSILYGSVLLFSSVSIADSFNQDDDAVRLRLRNELRRAEKPSAGSGKDIYAWVQGMALEYNSSYYLDKVGLDAGGFYVYKLGARDNWSTRWYLDGDQSFSRYTASIKIKLAENFLLKAGRMVTDTAYSGGDDLLIINSSSSRTMPSLSDALLLKYSLDKELDLYTMYRFGSYVYSEVAEGVHKTGPINPKTYTHDIFRPQYIAALSWNRGCDSFGLSASWQEDVSTQVMTKTARCFKVAGNASEVIKPEFMAFYANMNGITASYGGPDYTYAVSGQVSYILPRGTLFFGAGKTGKKPNALSGVDTDLGYPFDLSIDRNHNDMWSFQLGATLNLPGNTFIGVSPILTHGYEDAQHHVNIQGVGTNVFFGYYPQSGLLQGAKALLVINKAREHRNGSAFGDRLDYYDIKMNLQYDFMLK